ncbi:Leucine-rich repeat-containing protein [Plasmodiophora brassicae]
MPASSLAVLLAVCAIVSALAVHKAFDRGDDVQQYLSAHGGAVRLTSVRVRTQSQLDDLIGVLCANQSSCPALTSIEASGPGITRLCYTIGRLTFLTSLDLSNTLITELPAQIGHLAALRRLDLSNTLICDLPVQFVRLKALESLDISGTPVAEFPQQVMHLPALTSLDISGTRITDLPVDVGHLVVRNALGRRTPSPRTEASLQAGTMQALSPSTKGIHEAIVTCDGHNATVDVVVMRAMTSILCMQHEVCRRVCDLSQTLLALMASHPSGFIRESVRSIEECLASARAQLEKVEVMMGDTGITPASVGTTTNDNDTGRP